MFGWANQFHYLQSSHSSFIFFSHSLCPSICYCMSVCLFVCVLCFCLSICLFMCLPACLCVCLSASAFFSLSISYSHAHKNTLYLFSILRCGKWPSSSDGDCVLSSKIKMFELCLMENLTAQCRGTFTSYRTVVPPAVTAPPSDGRVDLRS